MASAAASSSAAVAALVQKASQQYLECRRKVTAKVDEVKAIDEQLQAAFAAMDLLRESGGSSARSVGRLEVTLAGVEGPTPAPAAAITVSIDPEFESDEDEFEEVEEVVEKRDVVTTDEHGHVVEPGTVPVHEDGSTPHKLKTTTKITRTIIKKKVKKAKKPVMRTIAWDAGEAKEEEKTIAAEEAEEAEEAAESDKQEKEEAAPKPFTFPATFVFDPVQSREAVVVLTVASASEEDAEPVKEIEFPISRLFGEGAVLDQWYALVDEEEDVVEAPKVEEIAAEAAEETEKAEETDKAEKTDKAEETEKTEETAEVREEAAEDKEEGSEEAEKADEEQKEVTAEAAAEEEEEAESTEAEAEAVAEAEAETAEKVVEKEPVSRFHVKATFTMSEIEKLSVAAMALSKKKQEADAVLKELEREAASLRTKYERLNASQRTLSASSVSKPKSGLLSSRFAGQPAVQKSQFQKMRESISAVFTPQRQQVLTSVTMFVTSVVVFHYQGENLLM